MHMMRRRRSRIVDQSGGGHNPNADEASRDPRSAAASASAALHSTRSKGSKGNGFFTKGAHIFVNGSGSGNGRLEDYVDANKAMKKAKAIPIPWRRSETLKDSLRRKGQIPLTDAFTSCQTRPIPIPI